MEKEKEKRLPKGMRKHTRETKKEKEAEAAAQKRDREARVVCHFCGEILVDFSEYEARQCGDCKAVEKALPGYLKSAVGRNFVKNALEEAIGAHAPDFDNERKLLALDEKVKHLEGQLKTKNERVRQLEQGNKDHKGWLKDIRKKVNELHGAMRSHAVIERR